MQELLFPQTAPTDDAFFQSELGWSVWGVVGLDQDCWQAELEDAGSSGLERVRVAGSTLLPSSSSCRRVPHPEPTDQQQQQSYPRLDDARPADQPSISLGPTQQPEHAPAQTIRHPPVQPASSLGPIQRPPIRSSPVPIEKRHHQLVYKYFPTDIKNLISFL